MAPEKQSDPALLIKKTVTVCLLIAGAVLSAGSMASTPPLSSHSQNNMVANRCIIASSGDIYLVKEGALLRMAREEGDIWTSVAEKVRSASIDPRNPDVIYTVTQDNKVMKTGDGGRRWVEICNGLPSAQINLVFISPSNSQEVFAASKAGLYITTDGGFNWKPTELTAPVKQFYINPTHPEYAYGLTETGDVLFTADSGNSWEPSRRGLPTEVIRGTGRTATQVTVKVTALFFAGIGNTFLLAQTEQNGLFRSDDNGSSWMSANTGLEGASRFASASISDDGILLAGSSIVMSTDGTTWSEVPVRTFLRKPGVFEGICAHPKANGFLVVFGWESDVGAARIGYVAESGALVGLSYGVLPRSNIRAVWPGKAMDREAIYATVANWTSTHSGFEIDDQGTYISLDQGLSWEYLMSSDCGTKVAIRPGRPNDIWIFGASNACILRAGEDGLTWERPTGARLAYANDSVKKIAFDPRNEGLLYYSAGVNENRIYRYQYNPDINEGDSVQLDMLAGDIVVSESSPNMLFAGVGQLSQDGGLTWSDKSASLREYIDRPYEENGYRRQDFTLLSFRDKELRIALHRFDSYLKKGGFWILRSNNLGDSWEIASSFDGQQLTGIFPDPHVSRRVFAAIQSFRRDRYTSVGEYVKVYVSNDMGDSWREIFSHKLTEADDGHEHESVLSVTSLADGRSILIGGRVGLWRSDDGGNWVRLGGVR